MQDEEEERKDRPVVVPADVLEGLETVKRSGAHMVERTHVLVLAKRLGFRQTVRWVEEHPEEYARGISHGFEAALAEDSSRRSGSPSAGYLVGSKEWLESSRGDDSKKGILGFLRLRI